MASAAATIGSTERLAGARRAGAPPADAGTKWTSGLRLAGSGMTSLMSWPWTSVPVGGEAGWGVAWCAGARGARWRVVWLAGVVDAAPDDPDEPEDPPAEPPAGAVVVWLVVVVVVCVVVV